MAYFSDLVPFFFWLLSLLIGGVDMGKPYRGTALRQLLAKDDHLRRAGEQDRID
jgi:hypothetical protein